PLRDARGPGRGPLLFPGDAAGGTVAAVGAVRVAGRGGAADAFHQFRRLRRRRGDGRRVRRVRQTGGGVRGLRLGVSHPGDGPDGGGAPPRAGRGKRRNVPGVRGRESPQGLVTRRRVTPL